jgi:electron transfer flavoprotein alpha/beta subunit
VSVDQSLLNWVFAAFGAAASWILKAIWDAVRDLRKDLREIEISLPAVYTRKDDFREALAEVKSEMREMRQDIKDSFKHVDETLGTIFKKLDSKEDKNAR